MVAKRLPLLITTTPVSHDSIKPTFIKTSDGKFGGLRLFLRFLLLFLLSWILALKKPFSFTHSFKDFDFFVSLMSHPMISFCSHISCIICHDSQNFYYRDNKNDPPSGQLSCVKELSVCFYVRASGWAFREKAVFYQKKDFW